MAMPWAGCAIAGAAPPRPPAPAPPRPAASNQLRHALLSPLAGCRAVNVVRAIGRLGSSGTRSPSRAARRRRHATRASPAATTCPSEPSVERPALPVGEAPAGALDHRHQRHEVVGLQAGLDDQVGEAHGQQAVGVAVAAVHRQADPALDRSKASFSAPARNMAGLVANSTASSSRGQARTRIGRPFQARACRRPRRPSARAGSTGRSCRAPAGRRAPARSACRTAGRPVMNDLVPSIGSSTQTNSASIRSRPCSSPRMPWSG